MAGKHAMPRKPLVTRDSTKRALRTAFDVMAGLLAVAFVVVPLLREFGMDADTVKEWSAYVVAATALVSKVRNTLEELGWIPAALK